MRTVGKTQYLLCTRNGLGINLVTVKWNLTVTVTTKATAP